jgi:hypothetical protein
LAKSIARIAVVADERFFKLPPVVVGRAPRQGAGRHARCLRRPENAYRGAAGRNGLGNQGEGNGSKVTGVEKNPPATSFSSAASRTSATAPLASAGEPEVERGLM